MALSEPCTDEEAARIYDKARGGQAATPEETLQFASHVMLFMGHLDAGRGWTKQLHLGALRDVNVRMRNAIGKDSGFDTIGSYNHAAPLARYLNALDATGQLPQTILYNLNPADNYLFACIIGNFQDGSAAGKIQFGSGWWFLDQKEAMEWQINALSNLGLLSRFVGMLTDSRSFLSYTRHEYFRRVLCNLLGRDVVNGELPHDMALLGGMVRDISYRNAKAYFRLPGLPE
jgi:glucuronate isomerase